MAQTVDEKAYEEMINYLKKFAEAMKQYGDSIDSTARTCTSLMDSKDTGKKQIEDGAKKSKRDYYAIAKQAQDIAKKMYQELEQAKRETPIWGQQD